MTEEKMTLVNEHDQELGFAPKIQAHLNNLLHRAFSVMIYNSKGELLIQQRAAHKYHSKNLWANTCCGHPRPGENIQQAAERRLFEEMGFAVSLTHTHELRYNAELDGGMYENEYVHLYSGQYDGEVQPNSEEVQAYKWILPENLKKDLLNHPEQYAKWFLIYVQKHFDFIFN